ncbi:Zn-dependent hydrolase [Mesorhizobium sp. M7A.F.Ca.CA.001.07.2.1]|uniref:Zn-dependent hydrolase n=6 Tax=Phyllobacteriaceae TaxID=69277 RepID=UPI000FCB797A|nr:MULTISPECIES: Zn-dependent hydrolase [Mesorhizobium]RVB43266.1 Zn-dependent hydrolase [Mesorhizobium sp. M7A.F.Ca.CA.004.05.1.1]MCF6125004.1 Zn-dependent hydrolase [Mesorhizobium ciceri]MCQ8813575.1 Zn-dependent hydrolase [Mesorhizobium sp. SEMIA396]RUX82030.1 Zn-dependent hydrolase [Mesorhizobium sp. M7A.F.Ca.CA.004.08.1.1]RUX82628.1 Zn-dependent hydrolase [Mesorhizobium sp. M7A.F.Ca.CA.004.08.2.1]
MIAIDAQRLLGRIRELGAVGRDGEDRLIRLAASDTDKQGRDLFVGWLRQAGLDVAIDRVGNIFGTWQSPDNREQAPLLIGSHIDTVIDAGIYDGCYGVLAGLEVIETLKATGFSPSRPIAVAAFTNEEGVRYTPDMMGSLVHAGGIDAETVLAAVGTDGSVLGQELARIGYAGDREPGFLKPHAYLELHIEQGPVLEREGLPIGAVENLQGISWQRITIEGVANHAGTTPMSMRNDAGHAAARTITFLLDRIKASNAPTVATVGTIRFEPNAINVIPSRAVFTIDLRDPDEQRLQAEEAALAAYLEQLATDENVTISVEQLARFEPVIFDLRIVERIEAAAKRRGLGVRRMTSGAGHDAQMLARIAPAAMIFVPSADGISHSPREHTEDSELVAGANILLDVAAQLAN